VHQKYINLFGNGEVFKAENETIRGWLNYIAYRVEDAAEQKQSFIILMAWVKQEVQQLNSEPSELRSFLVDTVPAD
jgi:hypothetical protein